MGKIISKSSKETEEFGAKFAKKISPGDAVLLYGNLGAGKTTFTKGFAQGIGIDRRIISPTFTLIRNYEGDTFHLIHVDLYRLSTERDLEEIGIFDVLNDKSAIKIVEWPERLSEYMPKSYWKISFETIEKNKRRIEFEKI